MKCKFQETEECINAKLFQKWKHNKRETAFLMLGVCPDCPVYNKDKTPEKTPYFNAGECQYGQSKKIEAI